jgi:hypothetical protein
MRSIATALLCVSAATAARAQQAADLPASEWTLERARSDWLPMVRPVEHVGVPGYTFQCGVLWDGGLLFGPLDFRGLSVMQQELAPLGDEALHVSVAHGEPARFIDRRGSAAPELARRLEDDCLPMPHVETRDGDLRWDEEVFAALLARPCELDPHPARDDVLVTFVRFTATNRGAARATAKLALYFGETSDVRLGYKCSQTAELSPAKAIELDGEQVRLGAGVRALIRPGAGAAVRLVASEAAPAAGTTAQRVVRFEAPLAPGARATLDLRIPYGVVDAATAAKIAALDRDRLFEETRAFWRALARGGDGAIVTPDPWVNDYLAAVPCQMAEQLAWRRSTATWMYKTSPNHYEGYWPCNAAKALPVFTLRGARELERDALSGFLQMQTDDVGGLTRADSGHGALLAGEGYAKVPGFLGNFGEWTANPLLISHGLALWALASHFRITRDLAWLGRERGAGAGGGAAPSPLQAMLDGVDWLVTQRRRTMHDAQGRPLAQAQPGDGHVEWFGLLPPASAHDWLAGSTIFNDAHCIYGMAEVVRLLRETGHPRADELQRELAAWRRDLHDRYAEATQRAREQFPVKYADGSVLDYVPRMVAELDWRGLDWTYTGYGPLRAGAWGALDPLDPLVSKSLALLERGFPKGEGGYFGAHLTALKEAAGGRPTADANWADVSDPAAPTHFSWRHYVEYETMWPIGGWLFLARDDPARFGEWLFNNLAATIHAEWKVGVESLDGVPSCAPGEGERWQLLRRAFVNESGGFDGGPQSLELLQAVPRAWLRPGDHVAVHRMGTWFGGTLDLEAAAAADGATLAVDVEWRGFAVAPAATTLHLRSASGAALTSATIDGTPATIERGDRVELPAATHGRCHVVATFAKAR